MGTLGYRASVVSVEADDWRNRVTLKRQRATGSATGCAILIGLGVVFVLLIVVSTRMGSTLRTVTSIRLRQKPTRKELWGR